MGRSQGSDWGMQDSLQKADTFVSGWRCFHFNSSFGVPQRGRWQLEDSLKSGFDDGPRKIVYRMGCVIPNTLRGARNTPEAEASSLLQWHDPELLNAHHPTLTHRAVSI